jgi:transposase InsO family protein
MLERRGLFQSDRGKSYHRAMASRKECLNAEVFSSLTEARVIIEQWRRRYNERRPHSSQNYVTPEMAYFGLREMRKA